MSCSFDKTDPQTMRLIEKMEEAIKEKKDSLAAKMWGYTIVIQEICQ